MGVKSIAAIEYGNKEIAIYRRGRVVRRARAVYAPHPWIPAAFRCHAKKLRILLLVRMAADGSFTLDLLGSSGYSAIDAAVLDSVVRWRFAPAAIGCRPVASYVQVRIELSSEEGL